MSGGVFDASYNENDYRDISTLISLPIPSRDGYTFEGWYIDKLKREKLGLEFGDTLESDLTLYAKFVKEKSKNVKVQPAKTEKYNLTLQFLESAYMNGNDVIITQVDEYELTELTREVKTYKEPINAYIIYDERPKVNLLKNFGWYREGEESPNIAYIPTHYLYDKESEEAVWGEIISGKDYQDLVKYGESDRYILKPLKIIRGTLIDVFYDFLPDSINRFQVVDVRVDTVSINYIASLRPYRYRVEPKEDGTQEQYLDFDSERY